MILCHRPCQNKTEYGYCKTTYCIYPVYNCIPNTAVGYVPTKPKTNADRIRHMTDEELAEELYWLRLEALRLEGFDGQIETREEILDWLREEVEP